jgi:transcription elongation factor GreB
MATETGARVAVHHSCRRARLQAELDQLWRVERPKVTQAVSEAAAQGDRSENAEYTYGKRGCARSTRACASCAAARRHGRVDQPPVGPGGCSSAPGSRSRTKPARAPLPHRRTRRVRQHAGYISLDAPLARALLGKPLDDEVEVALGRRAPLRTDDLRGHRRSARSACSDPDVLELPRIGLVEVLGEQPLAVRQRRPVGVLAGDGPR